MIPRTGRSPLPLLTETGEPSAAPRQARQRFRALNLAAILPILAVAGVHIIALQTQTWWHAAILGLGLVAALAQKLIESDPERVAQELREIYDLVGDTISQTRELAHGRRRLNLSVELENATNLLRATGIRVSVDRQAEPDPRVVALLAQVLRETTTNILRHARATSVQVTVTYDSLRVVNDGVAQDATPRLRGLETLARRVSDEGGELTVSAGDGRFLTAVEFTGERAEGGAFHDLGGAR